MYKVLIEVNPKSKIGLLVNFLSTQNKFDVISSSASDGQQDLVITDINMPPRNGSERIEYIKSQSHTSIIATPSGDFINQGNNTTLLIGDALRGVLP